MSGHELSPAANRHFSIPTLNEAVADLVNAHARLDISQAWGDVLHGRRGRHPHGHLPQQTRRARPSFCR
ncbi:Tn3 family transposase [Streptomyces rhizosphaericus]|uniref:Transposase n=1 Tax=Streptomyces rhizosphaericus TaxID=114699 RepID=A0A6G4ALV5_9ACTN|nr:transposase [Streptomyces rhizosphaericus]